MSLPVGTAGSAVAFAGLTGELHLTVRTHVQRAMAKLGARDRAQLVVLAYKNGLVD